MPGMYTREIKLWAKVLIAAVTLVRRVTGTTFGRRLVTFALLHGFTWSPVTTPEPKS